MIFERILLSCATEAEVSSQEDSIAKMYVGIEIERKMYDVLGGKFKSLKFEALTPLKPNRLLFKIFSITS